MARVVVGFDSFIAIKVLNDDFCEDLSSYSLLILNSKSLIRDYKYY